MQDNAAHHVFDYLLFIVKSTKRDNVPLQTTLHRICLLRIGVLHNVCHQKQNRNCSFDLNSYQDTRDFIVLLCIE